MTTYWAVLDTNNIVTQVITGVDDPIIDDIPAAQWYTTYVGATCVQTFIDNPNKNYAGINYTYDELKNNFIPPQPYPSWTLNNKDLWVAPIPQPPPPPTTVWNEQTQSWVIWQPYNE